MQTFVNIFRMSFEMRDPFHFFFICRSISAQPIFKNICNIASITQIWRGLRGFTECRLKCGTLSTFSHLPFNIRTTHNLNKIFAILQVLHKSGEACDYLQNVVWNAGPSPICETLTTFVPFAIPAQYPPNTQSLFANIIWGIIIFIGQWESFL